MPPNQSWSGNAPGSQANQWFTKPELTANAYCQANAETTVMIP